MARRRKKSMRNPEQQIAKCIKACMHKGRLLYKSEPFNQLPQALLTRARERMGAIQIELSKIEGEERRPEDIPGALRPLIEDLLRLKRKQLGIRLDDEEEDF